MTQYPVTWITQDLAVGYAPGSNADLETIREYGINAIVNLCAEFSDLHLIERQAGFEVCYLPVWDEDIPGMEDMEKALAWLDEAIYLGKKVLVHCRHGIGRTGTFVTSYMIRKGLSIKDASKKLRNSQAEPSNYEQWKLLKQYGRKSGVLKIREPSLESGNRVDLGPFFVEYEFLIRQAGKRFEKGPTGKNNSCGTQRHTCCYDSFDLSLIEVLYLHSKVNRQFSSIQRDQLIKRAVERMKKKDSICPYNDGDGCLVYEYRPLRCRFYHVWKEIKTNPEIQNTVFELSQYLFLAFSGQFMSDFNMTFSIEQAASGKFVQIYFQYLSNIKLKL